jgi:hypothetical protein
MVPPCIAASARLALADTFAYESSAIPFAGEEPEWHWMHFPAMRVATSHGSPVIAPPLLLVLPLLLLVLPLLLLVLPLLMLPLLLLVEAPPPWLLPPVPGTVTADPLQPRNAPTSDAAASPIQERFMTLPLVA